MQHARRGESALQGLDAFEPFATLLGAGGPLRGDSQHEPADSAGAPGEGAGDGVELREASSREQPLAVYSQYTQRCACGYRIPARLLTLVYTQSTW